MSTGDGSVEYRIKRDDEYSEKTYVRVNAEIPDQDIMGLEGAPEEINTAIPDAGSTAPLPGTGLGPDGQGAI